MLAPSIDVYLTYRCNLRCRHCFVGERLESALDFDPDLLRLLIDSCSAWGTSEVTFLGGEPTLYPQIFEVIRHAHDAGLIARVVTNGLTGLRRLVVSFEAETTKPVVGVSIDGSTPAIHDAVRGAGTFVRMAAHLAQCRERGFRVYGVTSISRQTETISGISWSWPKILDLNT